MTSAIERPSRSFGFSRAVGFLVGFVFVAGLGLAYLGQDEEIDSMWIVATVQPDGSFLVEEVIDYDFGARTRRGIFRDIPDLNESVTVTAESSTAPDTVLVRPEVLGITRVRIGEPAIDVRGEHRYRLTYGVNQVRSGSEVSLDAVGDRWKVPVRNVEVHVVAATELDEATCSLGTPGTVGGCEVRQLAPGHLVVTVAEVANSHILTISAQVGTTLALEPNSPVPPVVGDTQSAFSWWLAPILGALAALASVPAISTVISRLGREQFVPAMVDTNREDSPSKLERSDIEKSAPLSFSPPNDLDAAKGGVLVSEEVLDHHVTAWFVEAADRGEIEIDQTTLRPGHADLTSQLSKSVHRMLFDGRDEIKLTHHSPRFEKAFHQVRESLEHWLADSGLWDPRASQRRRLFRRFGWALLMVAIPAMVFALLAMTGILGIAVAVAAMAGIVVGAMAVARSRQLESLTPTGTKLLIDVIGFRQFLNGQRPLEADGKINPATLRRYTAWAIALQVEGEWAAILRRIVDAAQPEGASAEKVGSPADDHFDAAWMSNSRSMSSMQTELTFAASTPALSKAFSTGVTKPAPSGGRSSSGGFSGSSGGFGGSSGGGGGGGGGGSW